MPANANHLFLPLGAEAGLTETIAVSPLDCLIPIYLAGAQADPQPCLHRTTTPLVRETEVRVSDMVILLGVYATTGESRVAANIISSWTGCEVELSRLPDGHVASLVAMRKEAFIAVEGKGPKSANETILQLPSGCLIRVTDFRNSDDLSEIVLSASLSRNDVLRLVEGAESRSDLSSIARSEAIFSSIFDDLSPGHVMRLLQRKIAELPGSTKMLVGVSQGDVLDEIEEICEAMGILPSCDFREVVEKQLAEEVSARSHADFGMSVIQRIAMDVIFRNPALLARQA